MPVTDVELIVERSDGSRVTVLVNASPLLDEQRQVMGMVSSFADITARKNAEATMHESEERLRLALDAARVGIFDWELQENRVTWSRIHEELWGLAPGEFGGTHEAFAERVHPDDLADIEAASDRATEDGQPIVREFRVVWPDGTVRWVQGRGEVSFDGDGRAVRMRGTAVDITDRKQAEQALRESEEQLRLALEQADAVREDEGMRISRELHDELGQALTGLKIDLAWIERSLGKGVDAEGLAETRRRLGGMLDAVDGTFDVVRRISTELRPSVLDDLGLQAAIEWQVEEFQSRTGIDCSITARGDDTPLDSRRATAIYRILQEALTNISRHAEASRVEVTFVQNERWAQLEVRDDGRGVPHGGVIASESLGLIGMRERARALGGWFTFLGAPDDGATVTVRIPLG